MKFVKIPGKDFEMSVYQTTQFDWSYHMGENPSKFKGPDNPVENVSFDDIQKYIKKLNDTKDGYTYRLPTEEEWEYCCRAGTTSEYHFGDKESELKHYAWYYDNSENTTHPVGLKLPNSFGLYDMHGNVWEWTDSLWEPGSSIRVLRGGGWCYFGRNLRSAYRFDYQPSNRGSGIGFRLARTPSNSKSLSPSNTSQELFDDLIKGINAANKLIKMNILEAKTPGCKFEKLSDAWDSEFRLAPKKEFKNFRLKEINFDVKMEDGKVKIGCQTYDPNMLKQMLEDLTGSHKTKYESNGLEFIAGRKGISHSGYTVLWADCDKLLERLEEMDE